MLKGELFWRIRKIFLEVLLPGKVNAARIEWLRNVGVRIGDGCFIASDLFAREPYLVDIGDRVDISTGVRFITHDGSAAASERNSSRRVYGRISVGDDTFIGVNSLILPGAAIGSRCIVGAGSVVRGTIPDGSVVIGNPAKVVMSSEIAGRLSARGRNVVDTGGLGAKERKRKIMEHFGIDGDAD